MNVFVHLFEASAGRKPEGLTTELSRNLSEHAPLRGACGQSSRNFL